MAKSDEIHHDRPHEGTDAKHLADTARGLFYLLMSFSLVVAMIMLIFVWQPIWKTGFKDFHTVSESINKLDLTAQPASSTIPLMLEQMAQMNQTMVGMLETMKDMQQSMHTLEEMTPEMKKMNASMERMTHVLATQMSQMSFLMGKMENKFTPFGMMPFNW